MKTMEDICKMLVGNNYKVCFRDDYKDDKWIFGEIVNYGNTGLILCSETEVYQIPLSVIRWIVPNGLTNQKKQKMADKAIDETVKHIKETCETYKNLTGEYPRIFASKEIFDKLNEE